MMDMGCYSHDSVHYPNIAQAVIQEVLASSTRGILICGTGLGMSITANRFKQIRACLCHDTYTAKMSREHNNANILVLGSRVITKERAFDILRVWLQTPFAEGRHQERLNLIESLT